MDEIKKDLKDLAEKITDVESEIKKVEKDIQDAWNDLKKSKNKQKKLFIESSISLLGEKENQLRKEKNQLLKEKNQLRDEKMKIADNDVENRFKILLKNEVKNEVKNELDQRYVLVVKQKQQLNTFEPTTTSYSAFYKQSNVRTEIATIPTQLIKFDSNMELPCLAGLETNWKEMKTSRKGLDGKPLKENVHQHDLFKEVIKMIKINENYEMKHEYNKHPDTRPDFVVLKQDMPSLLYAPFFIELQKGTLDDNHRGKVLKYNIEILFANPRRLSVVSLLTNLTELEIIKSERNLKTSRFEHIKSVEMNFWNDGVKYLKHMLDNPLDVGYDEKNNFCIPLPVDGCSEPKEHYLHHILGTGATARVYSLATLESIDSEYVLQATNYVAKLFIEEEHFEREQLIWDRIAYLQNNNEPALERGSTLIYSRQHLADKFIQRVAANKQQNTIIFTPFCVRLENRLTKSDVIQMLGCLEELVKLGIVHRDLNHLHFMRSTNGTDGRIILVDFGSAVFVEPQNAPLNSSNTKSASIFHRQRNPENENCGSYRGSIEFAAQEILNSLNDDNEFITPHRRHDFESFVKVLMFYTLKDFAASLIKKSSADQNERIRAAKEIWENEEKKSHPFWKEALAITRNISAQNLTKQLYDYYDTQLARISCNDYIDQIFFYPDFQPKQQRM